jgi:hypothetical protein
MSLTCHGDASMVRSLATALVLVTSLAVLSAQDTGIVGTWRLNTGLSTPLPPPPRVPASSGRPGAQSSGGLSSMIPGMGRGPSDSDLRRMQVIQRRLFETPQTLTIVRDSARITFTDGEGRTLTLLADGKKQQRVTGDGEFESRAHFEGEVLVLEEDFGGGVKLLTRFAPIASDEEPRLEVTMKASGGPKPPTRTERDGEGSRGPTDGATRVYDRQPR